MSTSSIAVGARPANWLPDRLGLFGDERLARLVGSGSERAFAAIYERYHQPLYRYCRSIVRHDADAQDALQSTIANALAALKRGQRDAPLRPWLFRIAHNEAISLVRRRRNDEEITDAHGECVGSAEDRAAERERLALLVADLHELPYRQRGALVMRELSGLSHEEIALALDTSVGAAKQAIFEARRALTEFAEGRSMVCEGVRRTISDGDGRALRGRRVRAHIRACAGCAAFAAAIPARRDEMRALVPLLPPAASAAMLARVLGAGSGPSAGGGAGAGAVVSGAGGKTVGATLAAKAVTGAAVVVTAVAGVAGVRAVLTPRHQSPPRQAGAYPRGTPKAGGGVTRLAQPASTARVSALAKQRPNSAHHTALGGHTGKASNRAVGRGTASSPGVGRNTRGPRGLGATSNRGAVQRAQAPGANGWGHPAGNSSSHSAVGKIVTGRGRLLHPTP
jgi:RNA polymerase sigma factor (sigma-70 family)